MSILLRILLAFAVALTGGACSALLARTHKQLCAFISLGAGTLLGVTVLSILPECWEVLRWWHLLLAAGSGYAVFALISKCVFHICPACAASHFDETLTHRLAEIAVAMMIALAIHCFVDGLALAVGHEEGSVGGQALDLSILLAICVHKLPEGLALGAVLLGGGYRRSRMLWLVAAVEAMTIVGGGAGWIAFKEASRVWLGLMLAHAGGGFLYLAAHALLGEISKHHKTLVLTNFTAGFGLIAVLVLLLRLHS